MLRFRSAPKARRRPWLAKAPKGRRRHRIQAALEERVAAREPLQREPSTGECTVAHHGFARVVGARRHESARPVEVGRDDELVASNQRKRETRASLWSNSSTRKGTDYTEVTVYDSSESTTSPMTVCFAAPDFHPGFSWRYGHAEDFGRC